MNVDVFYALMTCLISGVIRKPEIDLRYIQSVRLNDPFAAYFSVADLRKIHDFEDAPEVIH